MNKKRLLLIFLFLIPLVYSMECVTYHDCAEIACIGSVRFCEEGNCVHSECLPLKESTASINDDITGVDYIVGLTGKIIFLALFVFAIAMLFPLLHLHRKTKIFIGVMFGILTIIFGLYIFGGEDLFNNIFERQSYSWDSDLADKYVIGYVNKEKLNVVERIIKSPEIVGGKEYKLQDTIHENDLIIMTFESNSSPKDIGLINPSSQKKTIERNEVIVNSYPFYNTIIWEKEEFTFILTGKKNKVVNIAQELLKNKSSSWIRDSDLIKINLSMNKPPVIILKIPKSDKYVSDNLVMFEIYDNDSMINESSIKVLDQKDFSIIDCYMMNNQYNCSFLTDMKPGNNELIIIASDVYGYETVETFQFVFDNKPWKIIPFYPLNGSYVNIPTIHFTLEDEISGIDIKSFSLEGANISINNCKSQDTGYDCDFSNIKIGEGKNNLIIKGQDYAKNLKTANIEFFYDITRPVIRITNKGFTVQDNLKLKNDSLMLDNNRYSFDNCHIINSVYHCQYDKWIKSISVMDEAGNKQMIENKLQR